ncbi:MAG: FAD-binding protein, partial [Pseudomonadota bacterium]|nr:FAD-binding protein [Pseudomonadota bacterium]
MNHQAHFDYDYAVIGSGFGGSVAALRLAEKGYRVVVIEQGRRWQADSLPKRNWQLSRWLWQPLLGLRGFFALRIFRHVVVLHGNAVGGGSITYANTLLVPPDEVWSQGEWAGLADWAQIMPAHYATAQRMLGVTRNRLPGIADERLRQTADALGLGDSYHLTQVGVYFGAEGEAPGTPHPDPYFDGEGPARASCIGCGGCMIGCRHGAKNTLDMNYLFLAEKRGAELRAETRVESLRPLDDADGARGYQLHTQSRAYGAQTLRVRGVVLAASSLGTQELLLRMKDQGTLPGLSEALGKRVRTNAESLIGVRFPGSAHDLSKGIAIGSGVYLDRHTHIEATRYPAGSDAMGLLATLMPATARSRPGWLAGLIKLGLTQPKRLWALLKPGGWARESMILLCMQTLDGHLDMRLARRWWWPFGKRLVSHGAPIPAFIAQANHFAHALAKRFGGVAM